MSSSLDLSIYKHIWWLIEHDWAVSWIWIPKIIKAISPIMKHWWAHEISFIRGSQRVARLVWQPSALGCTTFQYNNPNDNTCDYSGGYSKHISKTQLSHLRILQDFLWSPLYRTTYIEFRRKTITTTTITRTVTDTRTSNQSRFIPQPTISIFCQRLNNFSDLTWAQRSNLKYQKF